MRYLKIEKAEEVIEKDLKFFGLEYDKKDDTFDVCYKIGPDRQYWINVDKTSDYYSTTANVPGGMETKQLSRVQFWIAHLASEIEKETKSKSK